MNIFFLRGRCVRVAESDCECPRQSLSVSLCLDLGDIVSTVVG